MKQTYPQIQVSEYTDILAYSKQELNELEELYFMKLEENQEDFIRYEDIGNGYMESFVSDEYLVSKEEMIDYIINN